MSIITKPTVNKNETAVFTLSKSELALVQSVIDDPYFSDPTNWSRVRICYEDPTGKQREVVVFDATQVSPTGGFKVSDKAGDEFLARKIIIDDFDGGTFSIYRGQFDSNGIAEEDFDVLFNVISGYYLLTGGSNSSGQLGLGDTTSRDFMNLIPGGLSYSYADLSENHGFIIKSDGTLWAVGENDQGQLGLGDNVDRVSFTQVGLDTDWKMVSCGGQHTMAIKNDGTLWATGSNSFYQLGLGNQLSRNDFIQVGSATDWEYVHCEDYKTFIIKQNGTLYGVGYAQDGAFGTGTYVSSQILSNITQIGTDSDWKQISSSYTLTFALKQDGSLHVAGGTPTNIPGTVTSYNWYNVVSPIVDRYSYKPIPGMTNISNISRWNRFHFSIVKNDGTLWVIGDNSAGQLGLGDTTTRTSFTQVGSDTNWKSTSCSNSNTYAVKLNGDMYASGASSSPLLSSNSLTFIEVDNSVHSVYAFSSTLYALKTYIIIYGTNFTNSTISGFKIGTFSPNGSGPITDDYFGPSGYSLSTLNPGSGYAPFAAFNYSSLSYADSIARDVKSNSNASTWSGGGSSADPRSVVIDLGEVKTFTQARFYQTFADGKTTHVRIDISSTGNLETRTSSNWTPISLQNVEGTLPGQVDANGYVIMDNNNNNGTELNFSEVTARYIRVRLYNDGRYGNGSFTELFNMKLFNVT